MMGDPATMVSEAMQKQLREEMGVREVMGARPRGPRLALVHFSPNEAEFMAQEMAAAREALEEFEDPEKYRDPEHADGEISVERLGRMAEIEAGLRGHPIPSDTSGVPVMESKGSLKERAEQPL